jgi:hypothetical protein
MLIAGLMAASACQLTPPASSLRGEGLEVLTVADVERRRAELKGQRIRVEGFAIDFGRMIGLKQGERRRSPVFLNGIRYDSSCYPPNGPELIWFDGPRSMRRMRDVFRTSGEGIRVVLEGVFDDWNVPRVDPETGESNLGDIISDSSYRIRPGEYAGIGPLRDVRVVRVYEDRCVGGMPPPPD